MKFKGLAELVKESVKSLSLPAVVTPSNSEPIPKSYEEMGEVFYLDLNKNTLYTVQDFINSYKLDAIVKGIHKGEQFPPVFVSDNPDGSYNLEFVQDPLDDKNFGGNHRALAHSKTNTPLKCVKVKKNKYCPFSNNPKHPINWVPIKKDFSFHLEYLLTKLLDVRYK